MKIQDFDKLLTGIKSAQDLVTLYKKYGQEAQFGFGPEAPDKPKDDLKDLKYCSGAADFVTYYFTGNGKLGLAGSSGKFTTNLAPGFVDSFLADFNAKTNRIAYVNTVAEPGHVFVLVREGQDICGLYQANVATVPHYTLAPALNGGKDYNWHGSRFGLVELLKKLTDKNESNKFFQNKNNIDTYKAVLAEF